MSVSTKISIPNTSLSPATATSKSYTLYHLTLPHPLRTLTLPKRYSDFLALHNALCAQASTPPPAPFPPKSYLTSTISSPALTERRRQALETYCQRIATDPDPRWRETTAWKAFLELPAGSNSTSAHHTSTALVGDAGGASTAGTARGPIRTSTAWLARLADAKGLLRAARQAVARREQQDSAGTADGGWSGGSGGGGGGGGGASSWHEAGAEAKKALVRAGTLVAELERGLDVLARGEDGAEIVAEGEVRRRRDVLAGVRKERDALERVVGAGVGAGVSGALRAAPAGGGESSISMVGGGVGSAGKAEQDKSALLAGAPVRSQGGGGRRRVLGAAPIPETTQTRELDNEGVLQLQKQIMEQQDEDVLDLAKVVRRMREMGVQINDELDVQKAMLDMVDEDVDRVAGKVKIAKKRVGEIK
ncbi:MAG: hypothetical protein M1821_002029 [Bathelium mastoideum]|nr:MAG: hypothetical protein M1821_002029 [Bathelium mastoideum]